MFLRRSLTTTSISRFFLSTPLEPTRLCATDSALVLPGSLGQQPAVPLPGAGTPVVARAAPSAPTQMTGWCNTLSDCVSKADELRQQLRIQEAGGDVGQVLTAEAVDEYLDELRSTVEMEVDQLVNTLRSEPTVLQSAPIAEVRRTLYYAVTLNKREWMAPATYSAVMREISGEVLRRDYEGALSADDVLFVSTHVVMGNYYNRMLWNKMEQTLMRGRIFDSVDMATIKGLSTKLHRSRREANVESLDVRRKILGAMARRVGVLSNDFELSALLGILQCYTQHDVMPKFIEPLALRAINHIHQFTPSECAALAGILRRWRLMRLEVCEKLVDRICLSEELTHGMALAGLLSIRTCFQHVSEGGRTAVNAEPTKLKLRALGEQVAGRLDEVQYPRLASILLCLDICVHCKIYIPRRCLERVLGQAGDMIQRTAAGEDPVESSHPNIPNKRALRPITSEEARQLQALLYHYGTDIAPTLAAQLKECFKAGTFPDEASLF